jgi:molecular chaperone GrpE
MSEQIDQTDPDVDGDAGTHLPAVETHGRPETPDPLSLGLDLPADPEEARDLLLRELATAREEATSYLDDLRRVAADFDNFRKRSLREQQLTVERASERVLGSLLPVLDSFDAALQVDPDTVTVENLLGGVRSTHGLLMDILAKEGMEVIPTFEEPFNPEFHEAVITSGDGARLVVADELRRGYRLRGKVIRAALVGLEGRE